MKKRLFELFCGLLAVCGCHAVTRAQSPRTVEFELRRELIDFEPQHFYIAKVSDNRPQKDSIGRVYTHMGQIPARALLRGGVDSCIHRYLYWTMKRDSSLLPIELEINNLFIYESLNISSQQAELDLVVTFYTLQPQRLPIYTTSVLIEQSSYADLTGKHEGNIRKALLRAIKEVDRQAPGSAWAAKSTATVAETLARGQSDTSLSARPEPQTSAFAPQPNKASIPTSSVGTATLENQQRTTNLLSGFEWVISGFLQPATNSFGWGATGYLFLNQSGSDWKVPFMLGIERFTLKASYVSQNEWQPIDIRYRLPGLAVFRRIRGPFFGGMVFTVPLGSERAVNAVTGQQVDRDFAGVIPGLGLYHLPENKGVMLGLRLNRLYLNTLSYRNDLGLRFELGVKF
jgi:hypothetical protein